MKLLALLSSSAILLAGVALHGQNQTFPEPLASDFGKLGTAPSLKVHLARRVVGEEPQEVTLEFDKGGKFKLTDEKGTISSDGTTLTTYTKKTNTYSQVPLSDAELAKFTKRVDVFGWAAFLEKKQGSLLDSVTPGATQNVKGKDLQGVNVTVKPDGHAATFLIDPATGIVSAVTIKTQGKDYLVIADKVELGTDPLPDTEFAFAPPAGATMVQAGGAGTFADVQNIMNASCMPCHSGSNHRAGVDLSNYDGIKAVVTPKKSADSLLVKALTGNGVDLMPKGRDPLSADQIKSVSDWIDNGAQNQ